MLKLKTEEDCMLLFFIIIISIMVVMTIASGDVLDFMFLLVLVGFFIYFLIIKD